MSPVRMSKLESGVVAVLAFHEALNRHDVAGMMRLMAEDCIFENTFPAPDGTRYEGKAAVRSFWEAFFRDSPRARIEIEEVFGMGERCVLRWRYCWVDAAGQEGHVRGVDVYRVRGGTILEKLSYVKG